MERPEELHKIAEVIYNMIYNRNIDTYEKLEDEKLALPSNEITVLDIEKAIQYSEDLNSINGINIRNFIDMDLNAFLSHVVYIRSYDLKEYLKMIKNAEESTMSINEMLNWLPSILECYTYEEGMTIKIEFLKKITGFSDIDILSNKEIDDVYFKEIKELRENIDPTDKIER